MSEKVESYRNTTDRQAFGKKGTTWKEQKKLIQTGKNNGSDTLKLEK